MQERAVNGRSKWARFVVVCESWATTLARPQPTSARLLRSQPRFDIAKTLAPRMQRLELRPGREPIHAS
jgi:hypothetical protein